MVVTGCTEKLEESKETKEGKLDIVSGQMSMGQSLYGEGYLTYSCEIRIENTGETSIKVKEMRAVFSKAFQKLMHVNVNKEIFTKTLDSAISDTDFITLLSEIPFKIGDNSKEQLSEMKKLQGVMVTLQSGEEKFIPLYQ